MHLKRIVHPKIKLLSSFMIFHTCMTLFLLQTHEDILKICFCPYNEYKNPIFWLIYSCYSCHDQVQVVFEDPSGQK